MKLIYTFEKTKYPIGSKITVPFGIRKNED